MKLLRTTFSRRGFLFRSFHWLGGLIGSFFLFDTNAKAGYYNLGAFWKKPASGPPPPNTDRYAPSQLWTFGANASGQLGLGDVANRSSPVQIGGADWKFIRAGNQFGIGVKTNGSLWAWGKNDVNGNLGLGDVTNRSSPVQVGTLTTWSTSISTSKAGNASAAFAIKADKSLWVWGANSDGTNLNAYLLGLGDSVDRSSPVQLGTLTAWSGATGGTDFMAAIQTNGTLWSWGQNASGQLGVGDVATRSSPVQVGTMADWRYVTAANDRTYALKTDSSLWAWGSNTTGFLGLGDVADRSSPVQVGTLKTWSQIEMTHAIQTDGSLWAWGAGNLGSLGLGDVADRSSPTQVGTLKDWLWIERGPQFGVSVKTDGSVWVWGSNGSGQLGLGDVAARSSPVQLGTLKAWNWGSGSGSPALILKRT
jgi:alpha-tubulin suppressor-like RCC1 family protein